MVSPSPAPGAAWADAVPRANGSKMLRDLLRAQAGAGVFDLDRGHSRA
jgi:hypothetical protein